MGLERSGFAVGTGRCGTMFLVKLLEEEPCIASCHERNQLNETFHRYCVWNGLPVDDEGFLAVKEQEISADLENHDFSFEATAYLSLSIVHLYRRLGSKFILLARNPVEVVNSYYSGKNMYDIEYHVADIHKALGYHQEARPHHFFGRIVPRGEQFLRWKEMTRVGRLAWMWNAINLQVLEQFKQIPSEHSLVVRLEEFDYKKYREIGRFLGIELTMTPQRFRELAGSRINTFSVEKRTVADWSQQEIEEFLEQVSPGVQQLAYQEAVAADIEKGSSREQGIFGRIRAFLKGR